MNNEEIEKDLNLKILKVTMTIKEQYPELSGFLEEMPVTVPSEGNVVITLENLSDYYESLNFILSKYKLNHPERSKTSSSLVRPYSNNNLIHPMME